MTDLEINVALAKAMGWVEFKEERDWFIKDEEGSRVHDDEVQCSYGLFDGFQTLDYRDPVIFVAICKHWRLNVYHRYNEVSFVDDNGTDYTHANDCIEKAAALCVIELAKRGFK